MLRGRRVLCVLLLKNMESFIQERESDYEGGGKDD